MDAITTSATPPGIEPTSSLSFCAHRSTIAVPDEIPTQSMLPIVPFTSRHDRNSVVPAKSRVGSCCTTNAAVCTARVSGETKHFLHLAYEAIHSG